MLNLTIPIPDLPGKQDIEMEMKMNGHVQKLRYRVEVIDWEEMKDLQLAYFKSET